MPDNGFTWRTAQREEVLKTLFSRCLSFEKQLLEVEQFELIWFSSLILGLKPTLEPERN